MIVVNAIIEVAAGDVDAWREDVRVMEEASRAEAGCEDYTFSVELNADTRIRITECWADADALRAHFQTPHMATFTKAMGARPPENVIVKCYEATEIPLPRDAG